MWRWVVLVVPTLLVGVVKGVSYDETDQLEKGVNQMVNDGHQGVEELGQMVSQVVNKYLPGCHLVVITANVLSPAFSDIIRWLGSSLQATMVVDVGSFLTPPAAAHHDVRRPVADDTTMIRHLAEGDTKLTCRALLLDLTSASYTNVFMNFLDTFHLYLWPRTRVLGVGDKTQAREVLHHASLHNTVHALYLGTTPATPSSGATWGRPGVCVGGVWAYSRCLYCSEGRPGVRPLGPWTTGYDLGSGHDPFPEGFEDMMGHQVRVVAKTLFPFMEFERDSDAPGTTVTPSDSLDVRMLDTVAKILNFTYEMRMAVDDQWGTQVDGNWTGMVGTLAEERADVSMMLFWSLARKQVIDFTRIYTSEPFIMITHKPRPQPQHLALVRPFTVELWVAVLVTTLIAGVVLWAVQRAWAGFSGGRGLSVANALMKAWGVIMAVPLTNMPTNLTGQMVVGWWWVGCMLITSLYRSSLIAHLSVPTTSPPIDHLDQLLALDGSTWGIEPGFGLGWDWFKLNTNPKVKDMFTKLQILNMEEQMTRVLEGRHAFFTWKYYIKTIIASRYTDDFGYTPIHVSRQEFIPGSTGWGVRKGLPFLEPMDRIHDHLVESGLVNYWLNELFEVAMSETRAEMRDKKMKDSGTAEGVVTEMSFLPTQSESSGQGVKRMLVLSLNHLQGSFYILLLGYCAASLALLLERIVYTARKDPHTHTRKHLHTLTLS